MTPGRIGTARTALLLAWEAAAPVLVARIVAACAQAVIPVLAAWCTKRLLDRLAEPGAAGIVVPVLVLGGCGLLAGVLGPLESYLRRELDRRVALRSRARLFAAVAGLHGLRRFEDPAFLNRLRIAESSAATAPAQVAGQLLDLGRAALITAGFMVSLLTVSTAMTVLVCLAAVPALWAQLAIGRQHAAAAVSTSPLERRELFYAGLLTQVQAAKEIRLFGLGGHFGARMLAERRAADTRLRRVDRRELGTQGGLALLTALVAAAGLVWAALATRGGTLSIGDVSMFIAAVAGLQGAIDTAVSALAFLHHDLLIFGHFVAVEQTPPDVTDPAEPSALPPLRHGIELRDVWFRYADDQPWVLRGVDLFVPAGTALGLVGRNGAGKSTLVKLLCRLYEPTRGAVLWDGIDLREVAVADLRARMGAVFQDFMCYDLTAAENIGVGDLAADRSRIETAAARAGVDDVVAGLGRGYDTMLSRSFADEEGDDDAGTFLSGGQWQKLATARAMLRDDRDLLILDEPSSGLDAVAEHELHTRLRALRRGRTSVLISHRLGAIREADLIVTLQDGRIAETGDHAALLAGQGVYAELFDKQAAGYHRDDVRR